MVPDGVKTIASYSFYNTGITKADLPASVTTIGKNAFRDCRHLASVTISKSVAEISQQAFYGCNGMTKLAIEEFENFAERWPRSTHMPEVNRYLDEMREKLMKKDYEIAYGYYFIEEYGAAYESLKNFINLYPEAPMREDAMYYLLRSGYRFAVGSREEKQRERLQQVINDFDRFSSSFSNSKYLSDAQEIYTKTRAALAKLEKQEKEK